jgi:periplasmic protein TonB
MKKIPALALAILLLSLSLFAREGFRNSDSKRKSDSASDNRGEVYQLGDGITPPRPTYAPDPEYSDKARKKKLNGTVILSFVVGADGLPRDIKIKKGLSSDLDKNATECLKKWKFTPGMKDGQPVAVALDVEMTFRVY